MSLVDQHQFQIVNLPHREDRRNEMDEKLKEVNITNYKFIKAVYGKELSPTKELFDLFRGNNFNYSPGAIGCALSHYNLMKELLSSEQDFYIILEDDVTFHSHFKEYLELVLKQYNPNKHELLYLGYSFPPDQIQNLNAKFFGKQINRKPVIFRMDHLTNYGGAFGFILSKQGATKILKYIDNFGINYPIDNVQVFTNDLTIMTISPHLVFSDYVTEINNVDSDIQRDKQSMDFSSIENELLQDWVKLDVDYPGNDISHVEKMPLWKMIAFADSKGCVAFNNYGYFKYHVDTNKLRIVPNVVIWIKKSFMRGMPINPIKDRFGRIWEYRLSYDIRGYDIKHIDSRREDLLDNASKILNCVSFNTLGYMKYNNNKNKLSYLDMFKYNKGIYILKTENYPNDFFNSKLINRLSELYSLETKQTIISFSEHDDICQKFITEFLLWNPESIIYIANSLESGNNSKMTHLNESVNSFLNKVYDQKYKEITNLSLIHIQIDEQFDLDEALQIFSIYLKQNLNLRMILSYSGKKDEYLKMKLQQEKLFSFIIYSEDNYGMVLIEWNQNFNRIKSLITNKQTIKYSADSSAISFSNDIIKNMTDKMEIIKSENMEDVDIYFEHIKTVDSGKSDENKKKLKKDCLKILICGEPYQIKGVYDIVINTWNSPIETGVFVYYPLAFYSVFEHRKSCDPKDYNCDKTKFCAYMYSRSNEHRIRIFNLLNSYQRVDSLGKCCNNTDISVNNPNTREEYSDKQTYNDIAVELYSKYKFVTAMENTMLSGYSTEKLINPLIANSIPIYWGDSYILKYINIKRIIYLPHYTDAELIERIDELNSNSVKYNQVIAEPWFVDSTMDLQKINNEFCNTLSNVWETA